MTNPEHVKIYERIIELTPPEREPADEVLRLIMEQAAQNGLNIEGEREGTYGRTEEQGSEKDNRDTGTNNLDTEKI